MMNWLDLVIIVIIGLIFFGAFSSCILLVLEENSEDKNKENEKFEFKFINKKQIQKTKEKEEKSF